MKFTRRIRTVLYEDQPFTDTELDLLHTPALQRLYDLHQLGLTDRVFVDASHTRFSHVIGVMHMTDRIVDAICRNLDGKMQRKRDLPYYGCKQPLTAKSFAAEVKNRWPAIRLIGLLHDLTHAPYGHTLEDEIELVDETHDMPSRQASAFWLLIVQYLGWLSRETFLSNDEAGKRMGGDHGANFQKLDLILSAPHLAEPCLDDDFHGFLAELAYAAFNESNKGSHRARPARKNLIEFFKNLHFAFRALFHLEVAHKSEPVEAQIPDASYPVDDLMEKILARLGNRPTDEDKFDPHRDVYCLDIIGNTICADLLDYAKRDSSNAGLKLTYDPERIVENFTIIPYEMLPYQISETGKKTHPLGGECLRTAIAVVTHKFRAEIVGELISLLQVRYYVNERMLFHPTKCVAGAVLGRAVQLLGWQNIPRHFQCVGDAVFIHEMTEAARLANEILQALPKNPPPPKYITGEWIQDLLRKSIPQSSLSVSRACRQMFEDQLLRLEDVKNAFSTHLSLLRGDHFRGAILQEKATASENLALVFKGLEKSFPEASAKDAVFNQDWIIKLAAAAAGAQIPTTTNKEDVERAATELLQEYLPTVEGMKSNLKAGMRLLERLMARRYPKKIFCLMPRKQTIKRTVVLDPKIIADRFLDPKVRLIAENAIEDRSGIPRGTVVIHCPPAKGPQKLAEALVTDLGLFAANSDTGHSKKPVPIVAKLNNIADLNGVGDGIFTEHQALIRAMENMYGSMWRLSVGVCPPYDQNHADLCAVIGRVLAEVLTEGESVVVPIANDPTMDFELKYNYRGEEEDEEQYQLPRIEVVAPTPAESTGLAVTSKVNGSTDVKSPTEPVFNSHRFTTKAAFDQRCREIFSLYSPLHNGRTILSPHFRGFISKNRERRSEERARILRELERYDLSSLKTHDPMLNRQAKHDLSELTKEKLEMIAGQSHDISEGNDD